MNITAYMVSVALHVFTATIWIGGMVFMVLVLLPGLRRLDDPLLRSRLMRSVGLRFRLVGWIALGVLAVTGYTNLITRGMGWDVLSDAAFWSEGYGRVLATKLAVFLVILIISGTHDFMIGPKAGQAVRARPDHPNTLRLRAMATWFGRLNLLLAILMLVLGLMLSRGVSW